MRISSYIYWVNFSLFMKWAFWLVDFFQDSIKPAVGSQVKEAQDEVHSGA
jgi:hypothetical protein